MLRCYSNPPMPLASKRAIGELQEALTSHDTWMDYAFIKLDLFLFASGCAVMMALETSNAAGTKGSESPECEVRCGAPSAPGLDTSTVVATLGTLDGQLEDYDAHEAQDEDIINR